MPAKESEDWARFAPDDVEELIRARGEPAVGYLVWTRASHGQSRVEEYIAALKARRIRHVRTGVAWAEWVVRGGRDRITWYLREYAKHFEVLPCLTFTPPELGLEPRVNAPPRESTMFARFVEEVLEELGPLFREVELWNEWNLNTDWDPALDPGYERFAAMVVPAARVVRRFGKRVVLGGPSKVNKDTLEIIHGFAARGVPEAVDVIGFHNLRGTWSDHVPPPTLHVQANLMRSAFRRELPVWLTEYGFPVADPENRFDMRELEAIQVALFAYAVHACLAGDIERAYWYTYKDEVHESLRFVTTGWEDTLQFYYGDTQEDGWPRLLGKLLVEGGPHHVLRYAAKEGLLPLVEKASLKRKLPE